MLAFSSVVVLVEKPELDSVIDPDPSSKATLVLNDALDSVIEPLINVPIFEPNSTALRWANEPVEVDEPVILPLTSILVWLPDITNEPVKLWISSPVSPNFVDPLV